MSVAGARVRAWRLPNENERRCLLLEDCAAAGAVEVDDRLPKENDLRTFPDVAGAAVATFATSDLNTVPIKTTYRTKLTEIRRSNMISG